MTLPATGAISWVMIRDEFGGTDPISISDYYRGGGLVPDTAANANVPTSGAIVVPDDFWGASAGSVLLNNHSITGPGSTTEILFQNDGDISVTTGSAIDPAFSAGEWHDNQGGTIGNSYEIRCTPQTGDTPSGSSVNTWLALTIDRGWHYLAAQGGSFLIEIRTASDDVVQDSCTITMSGT